MKRRIVLLGPPASGKGTQAAMISARYGIPSASTGAMLRDERARGTALGREAEAWTSQGRYFPDEMAMRVVEEWLARMGSEAFLLDGFPRTEGQAKAFDARLDSSRRPLDLAVFLKLGRDEILRRILSRLTCSRCGATVGTELQPVAEGSPCLKCGGVLERREDDNEAAVRERIDQDHRYMEPVLDYYRSNHRLTEIGAEAGREDVFAALCASIEGGAR